MSPFELIAAVSGAVFGSQVLGGVVQGWFNRKKISADADATLSEKTLLYGEQLIKRIEKLEQDIKDMRKEYEDKLDALRKENVLLHRDLARMQRELELSQSVPKSS